LRKPALEEVIGYILIIGVITSLMMELTGPRAICNGQEDDGDRLERP